MKKRAAVLLLCGVLGLSAAACGTDGNGTENAENTESIKGGEDAKEAYVPEGSRYDLKASDYTTLCDYSAIPVTLTGDYEVDESDVTDYFESWYNSSGPYYTADETKTEIGAGDIADVDYVGTLDGEAFAGGSAEHQLIDVDANASVSGSGYIEGFSEGLKGASVGDVIDWDVTFPEDYGNKDLAGKAVVFTFTVNSIQKEIPFDQVDDAVVAANFSESLGVSNTEELLDKIRTMLTDNADYNKEYDIYNTVQEYLIENCTVEIPEDYLDARVADYRHSFVEQYCGGDESKLEETVSESLGVTLEELEEEWYSSMEKSVRIEFIMMTIAEEREITAVEEEFDAYVQQMVSSSGYESAEAMYSMYGYGDTAYGEAIFRRFYLCDRALDAVKETAVVTVAEAPEEAADGTESEAETETADGTESETADGTEREAGTEAVNETEAADET